MKVSVFLTSLFAAGGRGRQNSLPPERPRMRRLLEVPTSPSSRLAHSHALGAGVSCGISVRVDASRTPAGSVASRLFPRNRVVFRRRFGSGASEAALSGKFSRSISPLTLLSHHPCLFHGDSPLVFALFGASPAANRRFKTATLHTNHTTLKFPPLH